MEFERRRDEADRAVTAAEENVSEAEAALDQAKAKLTAARLAGSADVHELQLEVDYLRRRLMSLRNFVSAKHETAAAYDGLVHRLVIARLDRAMEAGRPVHTNTGSKRT